MFLFRRKTSLYFWVEFRCEHLLHLKWPERRHVHICSAFHTVVKAEDDGGHQLTSVSITASRAILHIQFGVFSRLAAQYCCGNRHTGGAVRQGRAREFCNGRQDEPKGHDLSLMCELCFGTNAPPALLSSQATAAASRPLQSCAGPLGRIKVFEGEQLSHPFKLRPSS